jgi:DsbC/DsbD-like thiol-disulfide interchange protein
MRTLLLVLIASVVAGAQSTRTTVTVANPQISMMGAVEPEVVAAGSRLTITFQVTPGPRIHVYAPGAGYQVVAVKLDAQQGLKARPVVYPPAETYYFEPLDERVPVYTKPFMLKQVVAIDGAALKGKKTLTLSGKLEYQACDDRVCFKPNAIPFTFEVPVKR